MVLPSLALGVCAGGVYGRVLLISSDSAMQETWVESWRINGVAHSRIVRQLLWRSLVPTIPLLTLFFAGTLASTAAVEVTFNIPGFGRTVVESALSSDLPVLQAAVFVVLVVGAVSGIVANWLRRFILRRLESDVAGVSLGTGVNAGTSAVFDRISLAVALLPLIAVGVGVVHSGAINTDDRFSGYSLSHPLGADQLGRDIWARLADGFAYSIGVAIAVTAACALIGLIAGHMGSWVLHIGDALNAFPAVLLGLILAGVRSFHHHGCRCSAIRWMDSAGLSLRSGGARGQSQRALSFRCNDGSHPMASAAPPCCAVDCAGSNPPLRGENRSQCDLAGGIGILRRGGQRRKP